MIMSPVFADLGFRLLVSVFSSKAQSFVSLRCDFELSSAFPKCPFSIA